MKKLIVVATLLSSFCFANSTVSDDQWQFLGQNNESTEFYYHPDVSRSGNTVSVWLKMLKNNFSDNTNGLAWIDTRAEFNCKRKTIRKIDYIAYKINGVPLGRGQYDEINDNPISPGTFEDIVLKKICK